MPVPASDAIASDVGHGAPGLRDNLRPFTELLEESAGQRHLWVEARPRKLVTGWASHDTGGTSVAVAPVSETFDGVRRDVVGVRTRHERLLRVDTLALCETTPGTYYHDASAAPYGKAWDDGSTQWDDGTSRFDQDPLLYVHLSDGRNPAELDIVAELGFFFGSHGVWQPSFEDDRLTDGELDVWTDPTTLTHWTSVPLGGGGGSIAQESTIVASGNYSCKITGTLNANGGRGVGQEGYTISKGQLFRFCGYYQTDPANPSAIEARLIVGERTGVLIMLADGRGTTTSVVGFPLANTHGEWRRFAFDFVAALTTSNFGVFCEMRNTSGSAQSGNVWFDGLKVQPISRFEFYEPRLSLGNLPTIESSRPDGFFGPISTSVGSLSLLNGNGVLEQLFAVYDWIDAEIVVRVGGRFANDGNEVLADDTHEIAVPLATRPRVSDTLVRLGLEDIRNRFRTYVPTRFYPGETETDRPRPLVLGFDVKPIKPTRIGETSKGYGIYEVVDCDGWPHGVDDLGSDKLVVYAYHDAEAAEKDDTFRRYWSRLTAFRGPDYDYDLQKGILTLLRDIRPVLITYENHIADFDIGGGTLSAKLPVLGGNFSLRLVGEDYLRQWMNSAAGVSDIDVVYDDLTKKFTVSKASGTLNLRCATGPNAARSLWGLLGFDASTDKTGALSYTSDSGVWENVDHVILRVKANGYADDDDGTYTGTPGGEILKPPDVTRFLLEQIVRIGREQIDVPSFEAARSDDPDFLDLYLGSGGRTVQVTEVIEAIETACNVDIIMRSGKLRWQKRDTSVPPDVLELQDRDYLAFEGGYESEDYFATTRLRWQKSPVTGEDWVSTVTRSDVPLRFGRTQDREFITALSHNAANWANTRLNQLSEEGATKRRRFRVTVKGRALKKVVGDKIQLTRSKGLDESGALSQVLFRIVGKRDDWARWISELKVIEVVI